MTEVTIRDNSEADRFEAYVGAEPVGFAVYHRHGGVITFTHTEVEDEGHGTGSSLVRGALDAARADGLKVRSECPFVSAWLDAHPDYQELLEP